MAREQSGRRGKKKNSPTEELCFSYQGFIKEEDLIRMQSIRQKRIINPMCFECLHGSHENCEYPKTCPCICNESDFPLNLRHEVMK